MAFVSVLKEDFLEDINKTWITFLQNSWLFTWIDFKVNMPDTDKNLKLPLIVLKRVSDDKWTLSRNNWYFGTRNNTNVLERQLYGYTYSAMIQFDIMTTSTWECNRIQGLLYSVLQPELISYRTIIPLRHFAWNESVWSSTDLQLKFNFNKDVDWAIVSTFNPNLHQHSVSVRYDIDYLTETEVPKMLELNLSYNIY